MTALEAAVDSPLDRGTTEAEKLAVDVSALEVGSEEPDVPAHRSHNHEKNAKRSDPFQFGSRYLEATDDVFEFNAWDHVEPDDSFKDFAEKQYDLQRQHPVSDFDKKRFNDDPAKWWNLFYKNNTANFFKDRKWLLQEFPVLQQATQEDAGPKVILEIGAGAGNTAFPILANNKNPKLKIHACDFAKKAVEVIRNQDGYDTGLMQADVWDAAGDSLPPGLEEGSVDIVIMIFIFSALAPDQWSKAIDNVYRLLKPGGVVCFRDYGRHDLAQVRFKKGRYLAENFYVRGDATRVYFFAEDELVRIWTGKESGSADEIEGQRFEVEKIGTDRRLIINRKEKLKMHRCWLQGCFIKKQSPS